MIVGIGVDIVDIARFRGVLERQGPPFLQRVFTAQEQEFCDSHRDPVPHYAVRFAAKEALFKALGTGWAKGVTWLDVEVLRKRQESPKVTLHGRAGEEGSNLGTRVIHLSLSHSDLAAVAYVVLET